ncbi:hypothetical protein BCR33DRAFT_723049 [Rhizoclosmatium globosum]|uniref:Uncharacterized protein n=1 Tax=Rhizoclosmatium globosum TaxID=329046 RepID=A0A1Y2BGA3_9FUNG|nr:hypothetical protein BCR33DRAFT_723049 [Rhizoclosmatium globosum]|eukprot:ORY33839.1 hypothetical protein BCR33DRAFT_723049 [Rhizoclosmatium globosum]
MVRWRTLAATPPPFYLIPSSSTSRAVILKTPRDGPMMSLGILKTPRDVPMENPRSHTPSLLFNTLF